MATRCCVEKSFERLLRYSSSNLLPLRVRTVDGPDPSGMSCWGLRKPLPPVDEHRRSEALKLKLLNFTLLLDRGSDAFILDVMHFASELGDSVFSFARSISNFLRHRFVCKNLYFINIRGAVVAAN